VDGGNIDDNTRSVTTWLEANLGGRVVAIERQARWRPVWFADLERDGESLALCVRGERADADIGFSLRSEMQFQTLLEEGGIPVAHVYGWIDDPRAYVMDRVAGRADFEGATEDERDAVMRDYMQILARVHALDVGPFADAGLLRAASAKESGTVGIQCYERAYRKVKNRPDPFLEFCLGWLARNPLDNAGRETPVVWDSGQFHHRNGRVEALLDLELGHLGDPMMDLAGFRQRDTVLGFGEFPRLYDHYAEAGGQPVDLRAIQHHHLCFTLTNELAFHSALADPPSDSDFMTNMQWASETNLFAVEALAEILGVTLREVEVPEPCSSSAAVAHSHLVQSLRFHEAGNDFAQHQVRIAFRLARHLQRSDEIGDAVVASNLDDLGALLGRRPANWEEGDAALERFVFEDGGRHDAELTQLFHRRLQRYRMLLGPPGSAMVRHNEIQGFGQARLHND
jgi:aminoglycoside phosphotransferase (APT) family kinase protein